MMTRLLERLEKCKKPTVSCFLGADLIPATGTRLHIVRTIDEAVRRAVQVVDSEATRLELALTPEELDWCECERVRWLPEQKYLRGIFAGGTFCYQFQRILRDAGLEVYSNGPLDAKFMLDDPDQSRAHTLVDMGDEYYTRGKPHPMIDSALRKRRIQAESLDPQVAVLFLDFILGYNASLDPVGELLDGVIQARQAAKDRGAHLTIVASVCGTEDDPQDLNLQASMLREQGVYVFESNARAALFCARLLGIG